jgi:uncharacterized repeat protein (TIGR01451 family)
VTGLLSAISGQFTKSLVLGALFPAAIFVLAWLSAVAPLFPPGLSLPAPSMFGAEWGALSITLFTLVVAGLLFNLDIPLLRLYEGYSWEESWLGRWRASFWRSRFEQERRLQAVLFELTADETAGRRDELLEEWMYVQQRLWHYPDEKGLVLPTRLGNELRAFERYPSVEYKMDAILLWPRMVAVIPPDYAGTIGDARTSLVFLVNLSFLSAVLAVVTLTAGLFYLPPSLVTRVLVPAAAFGALSRWFYTLALGAARGWGELVKGAFDLYRWKLLEQMGYDQKPRTRDAERALWDEITQQGLYGDKPLTLKQSVPRVDYADPAAPGPGLMWSAEPADAGLELARGVQVAGPGLLQVTVRVSNQDGGRRDAAGVVVTDVLAPGVEYVWDSATLNGQGVEVSGTNPHRFTLGDLRSGDSAELRYQVLLTMRKDKG